MDGARGQLHDGHVERPEQDGGENLDIVAQIEAPGARHARKHMLPRMARARRFELRNDVEILAAVLFWAFNMTVVKLAPRTIHPLAFNLIRFLCAASLLLLVAPPPVGSLRA